MAVEPDAWAESAARLRPVIARFCEGVSRYEFHAAACAVDPHHLSRSPEKSESPHADLARPLVRFAAAMELFHEFSFLAADGASLTGSLPSMIESFTEIAADAEALRRRSRAPTATSRDSSRASATSRARGSGCLPVSALVVAHLKMDIASKGNTVRALSDGRRAHGGGVLARRRLLAQKTPIPRADRHAFRSSQKGEEQEGAKARAEASAPEQPGRSPPVGRAEAAARGPRLAHAPCMLLYLHFSAARAVVPGTNDPKPMADSQPEAVDVAEICARRVRPRGRIGQLSRRVSRHRLRELHSACEERCAPFTDEPGRTSPTSADEERRFNLSAELKVTPTARARPRRALSPLAAPSALARGVVGRVVLFCVGLRRAGGVAQSPVGAARARALFLPSVVVRCTVGRKRMLHRSPHI